MSAKELVEQTFKNLDRNGDGTLSFTEIERLLQQLNPNLRSRGLRKLFRRLDENRNGRLSYAEFTNYVFVSRASIGKKITPAGPENMRPIQQEFQFSQYIELTEHRGILVNQLQRVVEFAARRCSAWHDTAPEELSTTSGERLSMAFLNLYHLTYWLIKPATLQDDCAFVELLATGEQIPTWLISHWWGEPVQKFVVCVSEHQRLRHEECRCIYWVCAYSNRQHSLFEELSDDPTQTSFYKAMQVSKGVLLILDDAGPATPFKRVWCMFEQVHAIEQENLLMDIATTVSADTAVVITEGTVVSDRRYGAGWLVESNALGSKSAREESFPLEVISAGLSIDIHTSEASVEKDRRHILNWVAGRGKGELDEEPCAQHESYDHVNSQLRAVFAQAAAPQAANKNMVSDLQLLEVIAQDPSQTRLLLDLSWWVKLQSLEPLKKMLQQLARLEHLELHIGWSPLSDADVATVGSGIGNIPQLRKLVLSLEHAQECSRNTAHGKLADLAGLSQGLSTLGCLEYLHFDVSYASIYDVSPFSRVLAGWHKLHTLKLNLGNTALETIDELGPALENLTGLVEFCISVRSCQVKNTRDLCRALGSCVLMEVLFLDFAKNPCFGTSESSGCGDVSELAESLQKLSRLRVLTICLNKTKLEDLGGLGAGLAGMTQMTSLCLLANGTDLAEVATFSRSIGTLSGLKSLTVWLSNTKVTDVTEFGKAIGKLTHLSRLALDMSDIEVSDVVALGDGISMLSELEEFWLTFRGTQVPDDLRRSFEHLAGKDAFLSALASS